MFLNDITFETPQWTLLRQTTVQRSWVSAGDAVMSLDVADAPPDWDFDFNSIRSGVELYQHAAAADGGVLLFMTGELIRGVEVFQALFRYTDSETLGNNYVGMIWIPFMEGHFRIHIDACETNPTGARECAVIILEQKNRRTVSEPSPADDAHEFTGKSFEHMQYDRLFPEHPLTIVRSAMRQIVPSVKVTGRFTPFRYSGET
jgi:hypothetical protein